MPDDGILPPVATSPIVEGACYVNIPQDQVLDVRDVPSGDTVVSSLENGTDVAIVDQQQTWVLINLLGPNPIGWVVQDYIVCGDNN